MSVAVSPSAAIKITNLRRPFTEKALRSHLAEFGPYDFFWLSRIKDVCLLQYDSTASAARAVPELNGRVWPEHGAKSLLCGKQLLPDYNSTTATSAAFYFIIVVSHDCQVFRCM